MTLQDFWVSVPEAIDWNHTEKIKLFCWFLHIYGKQVTVTPAEIKKCFDDLSVDAPTSVGPFLAALAKRQPKEALRKGNGYRLEARVMSAFDAKYGRRRATIQIHNLLTQLPTKLAIGSEKAYLEEALLCFKHQAFRAALVMTWNLAYDHLCLWVHDKHLVAFNNKLPIRYPKAGFSPIRIRDDFTNMKESEVIEVCNSASIITGSIHKILKTKLDQRNIAAHPSGVGINQLVTEAFISDIVENIVMGLPRKKGEWFKQRFCPFLSI